MCSIILLAIYSHPEFYPPTVNAAEALVFTGHKVTILCSNNASETSRYADGVDLEVVGEFVPVRDTGKRSTLTKIKQWLLYTRRMWQLLKKTDMVVLYDPIPLLSFRFASLFIWKSQCKIWYHNHDIMEIKQQRKYSISWWAAKNESLMFSRLDIFSLPAEERKLQFPMNKLKGRYVFIPNFPALRRYGAIDISQKSDTEWRIIFQGSIGPGHGIEEICNLLPMQYQGRPVKLLLKGFVLDEFKNCINAILSHRGALESAIWLGITNYEALAPLTASCHLGIAIFTGKDVMNKTLGTASNKIYEYAASGVPILYFDDPHFHKYLGGFAWALSTDLSAPQIESTLCHAFAQHKALAEVAQRDFRERLHFEFYFPLKTIDE